MSVMVRSISNTDDVIDSRDVIARIEELTDGAEVDVDELELDEDDRHELRALLALRVEAEGVADWQYGETLIRESYFEDYARQLAEDIGLINSDTQWPATCIDWERAANELKMDYTAVDFDGVTYFIRA